MVESGYFVVAIHAVTKMGSDDRGWFGLYYQHLSALVFRSISIVSVELHSSVPDCTWLFGQ